MSDEPKCKTCGDSGFIMVDNESGECCPDCPMEPVKTELEKALEYLGQFVTVSELNDGIITEISAVNNEFSFHLERAEDLTEIELCKWINARQEQVNKLQTSLIFCDKMIRENKYLADKVKEQAEQITALEAEVKRLKRKGGNHSFYRDEHNKEA